VKPKKLLNKVRHAPYSNRWQKKACVLTNIKNHHFYKNIFNGN